MPGDRQTPTVRLRRPAELRSLRASSGLTRDEIVERTGINVATLCRIEHARARPQTRTLRTLLDLYGVEQAQRGELIALLRGARQRRRLYACQSVLPGQHSTSTGGRTSGRARIGCRHASHRPSARLRADVFRADRGSRAERALRDQPLPDAGPGGRGSLRPGRPDRGLHAGRGGGAGRRGGRGALGRRVHRHQAGWRRLPRLPGRAGDPAPPLAGHRARLRSGPEEHRRDAAGWLRGRGEQSEGDRFLRRRAAAVRQPSGGHVPLQMLLLGTVFAAIAVLCDSTWALAAGTARAWLARSPRRLELVGGPVAWS
jgi:DNA-binding XRE family transcriptional regulator